MIEGKVVDDKEIAVTLELVSRNNAPLSVPAVVDTGFNGSVTLPFDILKSLGAQAVGARRAELGDGNLVDLDVYLVSAKWHGKTRDVLALHAESAPLIGMSLLWGSRVTFTAVNGGAVAIEQLD